MDVEIRSIAPQEFEAYGRAVEAAFGSQPRPGELDNERKVFEFERTLAAVEGERFVGTAAALTLQLTIPGGSLPMAGVTCVGVAPTHRRRGLLTALMRRQLDDVRDAGEILAGLWASEGAIYQRFGYGLAAFAAWFEIERRLSAYGRPYQWAGSIRMIEKGEAMRLFPPVFDRVAERTPGMWRRTPVWWEHDYADLEHWRDGATALFFAVYETQDGPEGYLAYRVKHDWHEGVAQNTLRVREIMADTSDAYAALWRFAFDHDLIGKIECWPRPIDEPLLHMLAHPRALGLKVGDGLWLRLVDVPSALAARHYHAEGRLVLEVRDGFCPWNEGRYQLEAGPDGATCRPARTEPDLVVEAADLGAVYLGGARFQNLSRAGRVLDASPAALRLADDMFAWEPQPFCPQLF